MGKTQVLDGQPTMREWPVRIWGIEEIKQPFAEPVQNWKSYTYLFGYGNEKIFYMREGWKQPIEVLRSQITSVSTEKELLNAKLTIFYQDGGRQKNLEFSYVPSVYYLYDPFLNWILGLGKKYMPMFTDYSYRSKQRRNKWMPWKSDLEEWLEVPMERGIYKLHTIGYLTECSYEIGNQEKE